LVRDSKIIDFKLALNFAKGNDEFLTPLGLRKGLKTLFNDYPFPAELKAESLPDIQAYYQDLSRRYGYTVEVPRHVLSLQSAELIERNKLEEAEKMLFYMQERYPKSADVYWRLGNIAMQRGELEKARDLYKKMLTVMSGDVGMIKSKIALVEKKIAEKRKR